MKIFRSLQIRHKLLFSYSLVFVIAMSLGFAALYSIVRKNIVANIESELQNTTTSILNLVKASATVSIKNYLRGIAEKDAEIVSFYYDQYRSGKLTEKEAKKLASSVLLSQTIGDSGYIYCLDSSGKVVVHPRSALLDADVSGHDFVQEMVKRKKGYMEYDWKNPGESEEQPKALYMLYFAPWDWIIAVSSYRKEFKGLVRVEDFEESVLALHFSETGYSFVLDSSGNAVIHPKLKGVNVLAENLFPRRFLQEMLERKTGQLVYAWQNPGDLEPRLKLCIFNYIPEYDWIVASSSYESEFLKPLTTINKLIITIFTVTLLMVLTLTYGISNSITRPLQRLRQHFENASSGDFSQRMITSSMDEIGQLSQYFNRFMEQLTTYSDDLKKQIQVRREVENTLCESEERYRSIMEAAADPIIIYDMGGRVIYFNPAFTRVFGWELAECQGRKMDYFVPQESWEETGVMIRTILSGETVPATETLRYTKNGSVLNVSVSGAVYRDSSQELAGSVIILRDITENKRLTRQLMDIGDRVRQNIGQDLHDDLCPHLIGIAGLTAVLESNLGKDSPQNSVLAGKIEHLIEEATGKARDLARGLCPVHLVSHGLQSALREIAAKTEQMSGLTCRFNGDDKVDIDDNTVATHLFYIAQEAVNNAVKHAQADLIDLSLYQKDGYIHLDISDDGRGLGVGSPSHGIGMLIMKYRASVIGASMEIKAGQAAGTAIHVFLKGQK
ncbi:MAG: cache domain-containing protein [Desulfocapsaceae bacterium]|nr:cache domain-containing protein [Desulfocapsaceae bacterium]